MQTSGCGASGTGSKPPGCHGWQRPEALQREPAALERRRSAGPPRGRSASRRDRNGSADPAAGSRSTGRRGSGVLRGCAHRAATSFHSASRLACSILPVAPLARGRALTTRSTAGISSWCRRNDSRMMRRMRLRATPPPAARTADREPQAWRRQFIAHHCHAEESVTQAPAARVRGVEIAFTPQATLRRQSEPPRHRAPD